jgi:hypothetical protein
MIHIPLACEASSHRRRRANWISLGAAAREVLGRLQELLPRVDYSISPPSPDLSTGEG